MTSRVVAAIGPLVLLVSFIGQVHTSPAEVQASAQLGTTPHMDRAPVEVPTTFQFATHFVRTLEREGVVVRNVSRSSLEYLFTATHKAAYIRTETSPVDVIWFPEDGDAEMIYASETRNVGNEAMLYEYTFHGQPTDEKWLGLASPKPMYFHSRGRLFVVSRERSLDDAIRSALVEELRRGIPRPAPN